MTQQKEQYPNSGNPEGENKYAIGKEFFPEELYSVIAECFKLSKADEEFIESLTQTSTNKSPINSMRDGIERSNKIRQRVKRLELASQIPRRISRADPVHRGFIHRNTEVTPHPLYTGFRVDDISMYSLYIDWIKIIKNTPNFKNRSLAKVIPGAIIKSLAQYFEKKGFFHPEREEPYKNIFIDPGKPVSIGKVKGTGIASCTEWTAATQNLLALVGINSHCIISPSPCELAPGRSDLHAYNGILNNKGAFIFDAGNPIWSYTPPGVAEGIFPAVYRISKKNYMRLVMGDVAKVRVSHVDLQLRSGKLYVQKEYNRIYR